MPPAIRRTLRRVRRPLLALIVMVLALAIGYGVRACDSDHGHANSAPHAAPHAGPHSGTERVGTSHR